MLCDKVTQKVGVTVKREPDFNQNIAQSHMIAGGGCITVNLGPSDEDR